MKAILIDVTAQTVTDIDLTPGLQALYTVIGCTCVDRLVVDARNDLWFDDEGLLHNPQPPKFRFGTYPNPLAGNAIITGYTSEGETIGTTLRADQVRPFIKFLGDGHQEPQPFVIVPNYDVEL